MKKPELLFDKLSVDNSLRLLPSELTSEVALGGFVQFPKQVAISANAALALGLKIADIDTPLFRDLFSARVIPDSISPFASVYSGHQFQVWAGQLGDGRAAYLAQIINQRKERWDIQLKGAGKTPYSRFGDGRAVLRSTIREFLCSEAMAALGIPTTRALSVFSTGEMVQREEWEPGAILARIAPSHIRFGHFEHFFHRKNIEILTLLANQVIEQHFPQFVGQENRYALWFEEIVTRTAHLMAAWQAHGFCHGVMNTDNMSILGLTIDYGPFGFIEEFDPHWICNHSDHNGLYSYSEQPAVAHWNLRALALALQPFVSIEQAQNVLARYEHIFSDRFEFLMCKKLALPFNLRHRELWVSLLKLMVANKSDFTNSFRQLADSFQNREKWLDNFNDKEAASAWLSRYHELVVELSVPTAEIVANLEANNPKYILRNWVAEKAIRAAQDAEDFSVVQSTLSVLEKPFDHHREHEELARPAPKEYRCLQVSCSS